MAGVDRVLLSIARIAACCTASPQSPQRFRVGSAVCFTPCLTDCRGTQPPADSPFLLLLKGRGHRFVSFFGLTHNLCEGCNGLIVPLEFASCQNSRNTTNHRAVFCAYSNTLTQGPIPSFWHTSLLSAKPGQGSPTAAAEW